MFNKIISYKNYWAEILIKNYFVIIIKKIIALFF